MKKMSDIEAKQELVKMLGYFDSICRENKVNYSLIGGSLIGAIRHKGMIPWDDDIDIILDKNNYDKLIEVMKKINHDTYKIFSFENNNSFFFPFVKLINTKTTLIEHNSHSEIENYGLFIDIFCYNNVPNNQILRKVQYLKTKTINSLLSLTDPEQVDISAKTRILRKIKILISNILGTKRLHQMQTKIFNKYSNVKTDYVLSNWPVYAYEKEIQRSENISEYVDVEFEGINAMIFKNYDDILKTTFKDYMKLPPENQRLNHNVEVYWKEK